MGLSGGGSGGGGAEAGGGGGGGGGGAPDIMVAFLCGGFCRRQLRLAARPYSRGSFTPEEWRLRRRAEEPSYYCSNSSLLLVNQGPYFVLVVIGTKNYRNIVKLRCLASLFDTDGKAI